MDNVELSSSAARQRFARELCDLIPSLDPVGVGKRLTSLAGEAMRDSAESDDQPRESQTDILLRLAIETPGIELFHTPGAVDSDAFATIPVDGHFETWPIEHKRFKLWLSGRFYSLGAKAPSSQALIDATNALVGRAIHEGPERNVALRIAEHEGSIWLDLCDPSWRAVKISPTGWSIESGDGVRVRFIRKRGMLEIPEPEPGGSIDELRPFVNIPDESMWILFVCCLVAYLRPRGPYPVLIVNGEQGCAKSTLCRVARSLVDPSQVPLGRAPRDERDLMILARNSWLLGFDNLSGLRGFMSDAICSLATGGGFRTRELRTDDDEVLFDATRPVLMNGIDEIASRADLIDRAILLSLPRIKAEMRTDEDEFYKCFEKVRPRVIGALLDAVSVALHRLGSVQLPSPPRMADFARWATAAETAFGWQPGTFIDAYASSRDNANALAIDSSPIGPSMIKLLEREAVWTGTAQELLDRLSALRAEDGSREPRNWPKGPQQMGTAVRRLGPALREAGYTIEFTREAGGKRRLILLEKPPSQPSQPSLDEEPASPTTSGVATNGDGDDSCDDSPPGPEPGHGLAPEHLEAFEERAAILEHDGQLPGIEAERRALEEIRARPGHAELEDAPAPSPTLPPTADTSGDQS